MLVGAEVDVGAELEVGALAACEAGADAALVGALSAETDADGDVGSRLPSHAARSPKPPANPAIALRVTWLRILDNCAKRTPAG